MTSPGHVIENPLSGERITVTARPRRAGDALAWELVLAPGGRVPGSHSHPEQTERFTVLEGRLRFRAGRRRIVAGPGDVVVIPPGTVHHFANAGPGPARVAVTSRPALGTEAMLETAAALARDQRAAGRAWPRPLDLALFLGDFRHELRAPYLPGFGVRAALWPVRALARSLGRDRRYRRLRAGRAGD
ncbi:MAG: cupin domain-containing protein [Nocardiopsaceae bacterium]|nr:cupin domain-containing protein [Nocardiopsaceae bacterium]